MGWVGEFGDKEWGGIGGEGEAKTNQEPSADKHSDRLGGSLDARRGDHNDGPEKDGSTTADSVGEIRSERICCE